MKIVSGTVIDGREVDRVETEVSEAECLDHFNGIFERARAMERPGAEPVILLSPEQSAMLFGSSSPYVHAPRSPNRHERRQMAAKRR